MGVKNGPGRIKISSRCPAPRIRRVRNGRVRIATARLKRNCSAPPALPMAGRTEHRIPRDAAVMAGTHLTHGAAARAKIGVAAQLAPFDVMLATGAVLALGHCFQPGSRNRAAADGGTCEHRASGPTTRPRPTCRCARSRDRCCGRPPRRTARTEAPDPPLRRRGAFGPSAFARPCPRGRSSCSSRIADRAGPCALSRPPLLKTRCGRPWAT